MVSSFDEVFTRKKKVARKIGTHITMVPLILCSNQIERIKKNAFNTFEKVVEREFCYRRNSPFTIVIEFEKLL